MSCDDDVSNIYSYLKTNQRQINKWLYQISFAPLTVVTLRYLHRNHDPGLLSTSPSLPVLSQYCVSVSGNSISSIYIYSKVEQVHRVKVSRHTSSSITSMHIYVCDRQQAYGNKLTRGQTSRQTCFFSTCIPIYHVKCHTLPTLFDTF
jgi:hypothetical protein